MHKYSSRIMIIFLLITLVFTTACGQVDNTGQKTPSGQGLQDGQGPKDGQRVTQRSYQLNSTQIPQHLDQGEQEQATIKTITRDEAQYIPIQDFVNVIEYNLEWDEETQSYQIGDNDVVYEIKVNSTHVEKEDTDMDLKHVPITVAGQTYIHKDTFIKLFEDDMRYEFLDEELVIYLSDNTVDRSDVYDEANNQNTDEQLNFEDDPEDNLEESKQDEEVWNGIKEDGSIEALKKVDRSQVINTARKYLGVKYKFGAKHYSKSKRFDCSSYTQYIFNKHGVSLNRIARNQAKQGKTISRKKLKKGDLLFFYIPGRFKSNKKIGHVGIYLGGSKMIHAGTEPKNGVQITNINSSYWKRTFIKAKRVVQV